MSVQTLVSSPLTENWISKAIFQSAGGYDTGLNRDMPLSEAETIGQEFIELSGAKSLEELRAIPAEKIVELQEEFGRVNPSRMLSFVPNIDNHLLTCGYNDAVTEGKIKDIPYMLGSTADDIGVFPEIEKKKASTAASIRDASTGALRWKNSEENRLTFTTSPVPC